MLERYFVHILKNPDTLLCRFYGLLEIESPQFKGILIVMNNVTHSKIIRSEAPAMIKFDLKGSSRGRVVDRQAVLDGTTAKDLNWTNEKRKIRLGTKMGKLLLDQLERDAKLLMENKILDYSLLLGVIRSDDAAIHASQWDTTLKRQQTSEDDEDAEDWRLRSRWSLYHGGMCGQRIRRGKDKSDDKDVEEKNMDENSKSSSYVRRAQIEEGHKILSREFQVKHLDRDDPFRMYLETAKESNVEEDNVFEIYYMGIIDILQDWTTTKILEHNVKAVSGFNSTDMSAVSPADYFPRFVNFMKDEVVECGSEIEES